MLLAFPISVVISQQMLEVVGIDDLLLSRDIGRISTDVREKSREAQGTQSLCLELVEGRVFHV